VQYKEYLHESVAKLSEIYSIHVDCERVLPFKELMMIKNQQNGYFFEYKKNRTVLLKKHEPPQDENIYEMYMKRIKDEKIRIAKKKEAIKLQKLALLAEEAGKTE